ncbi:hypothetical protein Q4Q54_16685 [Shewanella sp. SP2S2-4]|uniref:hypothetical protein n=1 Tax=Shewanella sp. SP2S2-4 TaxID=3063539 RepID=UPI00288E8511|nr:hypothetical protein [Shewanella sp. SP2S2-4]MDT3275102.1 hypothetical protein [Shewanella sp. SP2S2-4]
MKSIFNTLDIFVGYLSFGIMTFLLYFSLGSIAILSLLAIPVRFFEYGSGINELDLAEVGSLVLLCLVIWRFFSRGASQQWRRWQLVRRFIFVVAMNTLVVSFFLFLLFILVIFENGKVESGSLYKLDELITFSTILTMILSIYAAAPLAPFYSEKHDASLSAPSSFAAPESDPSSDSDGSQSTCKTDFEDNLKNYRAPDNPWEKA